MNREEVLKVLKSVFNTVAPEIDFVKIDISRPLRSQVEIDSMDFYRMLVLIHQQTGINIPDSKFRELKNLEELTQFIISQSNHRPQLGSHQ
jgi:acyl carrier protein